jgi:hypothetical protein
MQKVEQDAIDQIAEQLIQQRNELSIEEASAFVYSDGGQR